MSFAAATTPRRLLLLVAGILVVLAAVALPRAAARAQPAAIAFEDCGGGWECGSLGVPLDYDDPAAATVDVAIARLPARKPGERVGVLLTNPGGPGAGGIGFARAWARLLDGDVRDRFDIVAFDPRGTGDSSPVNCSDYLVDLFGVDQSPDDQAEFDTLITLAEDYAGACRATYGDILDHLGTRNVARDMDRIREALGEDTVSYVGYSYGTRIGAVYADLFPHRVRAFVLDGAIDNSLDNDEAAARQAAGFELALHNFLADCEERDCPLAGNGDPYDVVAGILAAAEQQPIPAPGASRPARPGEVVLGIIAALYDELTWPVLSSALEAARDGDASRLVSLADSYLSLSSTAVLMAVNCADAPLPADPVDTYLEYQAELPRLLSLSPTFGPTVALDTCRFWTGEPDPIGVPDAEGAPPIIVIGTTGDPATPYEWAVALADQLQSGVLIRHEGEGHTVYASGGSDCVDGLVNAFLVDLAVPGSGVTCAGDEAPVTPSPAPSSPSTSATPAAVTPTPRPPDAGVPSDEAGRTPLVVALVVIFGVVLAATIAVAKLWRRA